MSQTTVSGSTVALVSLEEIKEQLRIDHDEEDAYLAMLLAAETLWAEGYLNRALITQTRDVFYDEWPLGKSLELPRPPLSSVTSVSYTTQGSTTEYASSLSSTAFWVDTDSEPGRVVLKENQSWPTATLDSKSPIRVRYVAGYGQQGSDVPEQVRLGVLLNVGARYWNRENVSDAETFRTRAAERLLYPLRVFAL